MSAVDWSGVSFAHPGAGPVLREVDLTAGSGDLLLVMGSSGSGKSTLLRTVNGLVPHTTGGRFRGTVTVSGRSTTTHRPRDLADVVGFVHQDPESQFVVDEVEGDLAFALENLGAEPAAMRRRVEEVLDALGLARLRHRSPTTLSGGERQRAAIAGAIAAGPSVLVLDEPTSELDPQGADDVLAAVDRLRHDLGTTVVLAEHRLERAATLADRAVVLDAGTVERSGRPAEVVAGYAGAPPVSRLGRLLGWDPVPLTVREARRLAAATAPPEPEPVSATRPSMRPTPGAEVLALHRATLANGRQDVLVGVDFTLREGEIVALLGRNGSGKSTVLRALAGMAEPRRGTVERSTTVGLVPQDPNALLFAPTVRAELAQTVRLRDGDEAMIDRWLARLDLDQLADRHPRSLSAGQRQRVAIAAIGVADHPVLLLDEPTRGIDPPSADALERALLDHSGAGGAAVLATHDVELAARVADRVVVLGDGDVVADGPARDVLAGSLFAPQVLRVLPPFLTVDEVAAAQGTVLDR